MTLLIGALTIGLILSLLALGVFISFRVFEFPDITADGSITLGAALAAILLVNGVHPIGATAGAFAAGALAGTVTGIIHTRFGINKLLSGILVMTALYSINLHVMGKSNVPLLSERTLATLAERGAAWVRGGTADLDLWGCSVGCATPACSPSRSSRPSRSQGACTRSSGRTWAPRCRPPATTRR
jgi:putative ABC transport system permease protein